MGKPLSPEQKQATVDANKLYPNNHAAAARALKISHHTYCYRLSVLRRDGFEPATGAPATGSTVDERAARDKQRERDRTAELVKENTELRRALNDQEDYRAAIFGLGAQEIHRKQIPLPPEKTASSIDIPVLLTSDFQYGERVRADEMDGINSYDPETAQRRYKYLIQSACSLISDHVPNPAYPGIYLWRGGDSISGRIHDELAETNALSDPECVRDLVGMEADGINTLHKAALKATKQRSIKFRVLSIPGNHGRTTKKPRSKGYTRMSLETIIAWNIEREFKNVADVEFTTPMSGDIYEKIYNTPFLFTHGDRIGSRGGTGFIGAAATIMRGVHKTRQQYAGIGKPVRYVVVGHFHDCMFLPHAIVNNNLCGFNEYARDLRFEAAPPSQVLFFVNPKWSVTTRREIILEERTADGRAWNNISSDVT